VNERERQPREISFDSRRVLPWILVGALALAAVDRLVDGVRQLVWLSTPPVDLAMRWHEVHRWFAGQPLYTGLVGIYPPATYALLWPALGWLDLTPARWLWAVTTLAALGWFAYIVVRESETDSVAARCAVGLLPVSVYAARAVMVNGQFALHLLPPLLAGLLLLHRRRPSWGRDLGATALLLISLAKPTLSIPFMWAVLAARGPWRPAVLLGLGYGGLTLLASLFQPAGAVRLFGQFLASADGAASTAARDSHANLHAWIDALGLGHGYTLASLIALLAVGWWTLSRARGTDPWLTFGVAATVARFWTFHFRYDDMLLLVPMVALIRVVARREPGSSIDRGAVLALGLLGASLLIPARLLLPPYPWQAIEAAQTLVWLGALGVLLGRARYRPVLS